MSDTSEITPPAGLPLAASAAEVAEARRRDGSIVLLDVRSPAEFQAVHIPGSYNVPLDQVAEHRAEFWSVGAPIVLVCRSGTRARQAETVLRDAGADRLHVLDGGVGAWQGAGLPVVRGRAAWSVERQVRAIAGGLVTAAVLGGLLVWQPLVYLALLVGAGLLFAGLTDWCGLAKVLMLLPFNRQATASDICDVLARLKQQAARPVAV